MSDEVGNEAEGVEDQRWTALDSMVKNLNPALQVAGSHEEP